MEILFIYWIMKSAEFGYKQINISFQDVKFKTFCTNHKTTCSLTLHVLVYEPAREQMVDWIWTSNVEAITNTKVPDPFFSNIHKGVDISMDVPLSITTKDPRNVYLYSDGGFESINIKTRAKISRDNYRPVSLTSQVLAKRIRAAHAWKNISCY